MIKGTNAIISRPADIGGRKILGKNNLSTWIWTGNTPKCDQFISSTKKNKNKKTGNILATIGVLATIAAGATAAVICHKKGYFQEGFSKLKNIFKKQASNLEEGAEAANKAGIKEKLKSIFKKKVNSETVEEGAEAANKAGIKEKSSNFFNNVFKKAKSGTDAVKNKVETTVKNGKNRHVATHKHKNKHIRH